MELNIQQSIGQANLMNQGNRLSQLQESFKNPEDKDHKELKKAAQQFESIFVKQLLDAMDKTVDRENSILSGGSGEGYFRGMLNDHIAQSFTDRPGGSGFGLAENIYRQMADQMRDSETKVTPKLQMGNADQAVEKRGND